MDKAGLELKRQADHARADFAALEDAFHADQEGTGTPRLLATTSGAAITTVLVLILLRPRSAAPQTKPPYFRANSVSG
jgi:hypothetical protein